MHMFLFLLRRRTEPLEHLVFDVHGGISAEHVRLERSRTGTGARLTVHATGRNPVELTRAGGGATLLLQRGGQASAPLVDGDVLRLVVDRNEFTNKRRWEQWAGNACAYRARLNCK